MNEATSADSIYKNSADHIADLESRLKEAEQERDEWKWKAVTYKAGKNPWVPWSFRDGLGDSWTVLTRSGTPPGEVDPDGKPFGRFSPSAHVQQVANAINLAESGIREAEQRSMWASKEVTDLWIKIKELEQERDQLRLLTEDARTLILDWLAAGYSSVPLKSKRKYAQEWLAHYDALTSGDLAR